MTMEKDNENLEKQTDKDLDENGSVLIEEHIKIFDPETDETYINFRG